jgi:hypothetical protein
MAVSDDLFHLANEAAETLAQARSPAQIKTLAALRKAAEQAWRAWSGSNLGYHATVYYADLQPPPAGVQFSPEWGLIDRWPTHQPDPGWQVMDHDAVFNELVRRAGSPNIPELTAKLASIRRAFSSLKERAISILIAAQAQASDPFLDRKFRQIETLETLDPQSAESTLVEPGAGWSRDSTAVTQGGRIAPHQCVLGIDVAATATTASLDTLEKAVREAALHLQRAEGHRTPHVATTNSKEPSSAFVLSRPFEEYDELAGDVAGSKYQFFCGNVRRWIDLLDRTPSFSEPIRHELEGAADFKVWFEPYRVVAMGHGSRAIEWPRERAERLGIQILLFRRFAAGDIDPGTFALTILQSGKHINDGIADIVNQIFTPLARELKRYLQRKIVPPEATSVVPAADREVTLDHNSKAYAETTMGLDTLVEALEQTNEYCDAEDKQEKIAELSAGRRLLRALRVRYVAITALLGPPLVWLAGKFAGSVIGQIAETVWQSLKALIGL